MGFADLRRRIRHHRRRLVCRAAVELMTDYLEDALAPPDRRRFERHLAGCAACTAYLAQMRATVDTLGHLDADDLPADVLEELIELYRRVRAG